jgi:nucleoside-diphosphate-sugar epimerase
MASQLGSGAPILLLGGSGITGRFLIERMAGQGVHLLAVSRYQPARADDHVIWLQHDLETGPVNSESNVLISLGPLSHALGEVEASGPRLGRVIALSSASTAFKMNSPDVQERQLMSSISADEDRLNELCAQRNIDLTLLKPTMIYGAGRDANVSRVGALVRRLGLIPYCGRGLRHPVHADDLARLVVDCLIGGRATTGSWLLGGGEALDYPTMLSRIAAAGGRPVRLVRVPAWSIKLALLLAHASGRLRDVRPVMLERQKTDLLVDDQPAREFLDWNPRPFRP